MSARSRPGPPGRTPVPTPAGSPRGHRTRSTGAAPGGYRAGTVALYRLDARRAVAALPVGSIDVLITDPPYRTVDRSGGHLKDWFGAGLSWRQIGAVLAIARTRLAPDGVAFVMTNGAGLREALDAMAAAGFERVRIITWDRRYPGLGGGLRHQTEHVLVGQLPGSRTLSGTDLISVAAVGPGTADRYPTEKPAGLGRELARIANVRRGELVLDPFCGSGALLVGARERGAAVIGIDVADRAIRHASERLGAVVPVPAGSSARPRPRTPATARRPAGRTTPRRRP